MNGNFDVCFSRTISRRSWERASERRAKPGAAATRLGYRAVASPSVPSQVDSRVGVADPASPTNSRPINPRMAQRSSNPACSIHFTTPQLIQRLRVLRFFSVTIRNVSSFQDGLIDFYCSVFCFYLPPREQKLF